MAVPDEAAVATKKSAWTNEEDALLREQVRLDGPQNWAAISEALPERNPKSCRLRWWQHLSPVVDTTRPFTPQEDEKIIVNFHNYPNKWATIASILPGRTDNAIKNRWHSVLGKVYQHQQQRRRRRAAAPIRTSVLFPLAPGDVKAIDSDMMIPEVCDLPPEVDLSSESLKLFPLVAGDVVRGNKAGEAAAMDVDYSTSESLVELRLSPSTTNHEGGVQRR